MSSTDSNRQNGFHVHANLPRTHDSRLEELKQAANSITPLPNEPLFHISDEILTCFLVARNYSVHNAFKQLEQTVEWRRNFNPFTSGCMWCTANIGYHSIRQIGFDSADRPIIYSCFTQCQSSKHYPKDIIDHMVYLMENAMRCNTSTIKLPIIFIIDCSGFSMSYCNLKIGKSFINVFSNYYPESLFKFVIINQSSLFTGLWKAIKTFVDSKTSQKVILVKNKNIQSTMESMFDVPTSSWLLQEISLNKSPDESQLRFWEYNADQTCGSIAHDPRGTESYIRQCIAPLVRLLEQNPKLYLNRETLGLPIHMPHPNIVDHLNGAIEHVKIKHWNASKSENACKSIDEYMDSDDEDGQLYNYKQDDRKCITKTL